MKIFRKFPIALVLAAASLFGTQDLGQLKTLLLNRTDENHKAVGIVVGLVDATGDRFLAAGKTAPGGSAAPDADTVFEIGSITKVFTSLVLADMVGRGEVKLDDPVAKFLPPTVKVPSRDGRPITLIDLSNQTSGLPRLPDNLKPADAGDPYADYGPAQLYDFLSRYELPRAVGEKYEYSNLGVGLLGHALALKAGMGYEELVRRRVLEPLGMNDTSITLPERLKGRLAAGTGPNLSPVKNWGFDAVAAAGALRSTARDMLKFLAAAMGLRETPLRGAFDLMLKTKRPTGTPDLDIAMGWHIWTRYGTEIVWHNGGTGGYRSFAGFAPAKKTGVVILCNTSFGVDDLGLHALEPQWPVGQFRPPLERKPIAVAGDVLEGYVGEYELRPGLSLTVTRTDGKLFIRATGQAQFEYAAASPTEFFRTIGDVRVTFVKNAEGAVTRLLIYQDGFEHEAKRVVTAVIAAAGPAKTGSDDLAIWKEFTAVMKAEGLPSTRVRPYYENLREPILGWLKEMREKATWTEWDKAPEIHRVGDHVHFLIPLTFDGQTASYCLTFLVEGGAWFFRHIEAINIRLDKTGPLPTSTFPDVDEKTKAHIREETMWSREIRVFNEIAALKGKASALDFFKDGEGYFLAAKTWVPFVEPRRAFILHSCWEQANLRGNAVTLEKLDDREAVVRMSAHYFRLYKESAHLAQQVSFEDYTKIFETIWQDRARAAGWSLAIEYVNEGYRASQCVLRFKRPS